MILGITHSLSAWAYRLSDPTQSSCTRTRGLTIRCEYPDGRMEPTCVSFRLSPQYHIHPAREAHDWFLRIMQEHEESEVDTDQPGQLPMPFVSETVRRVRVE